MKAIDKRLTELENTRASGFDKVHQVIQEEGQTKDEAIAASGIVVGPRDLLIIRRIVSPKFDANGSIIPQPVGVQS